MPKSEISNLQNQNFVANSSRYINSKILSWGDLKTITFETYKRSKYEPKESDRFYTITPGVEYRPDLISNKVYGDPSFWWWIMQVNNIQDILDFKAGTNIIIPGSTP